MAATLTVIWWRDIPAQVIAKDRRQAHKIVLHPRFQTAIDRAAMKAGRKVWDLYIAEWRKEMRACGSDLEAEARAEAERLEAEYTKERLAALATAGGVDESRPRPDADGGDPASVAGEEPATGETAPSPGGSPS